MTDKQIVFTIYRMHVETKVMFNYYFRKKKRKKKKEKLEKYIEPYFYIKLSKNTEWL